MGAHLMEKHAIWSRYSKIHDYPKLQENISVEVAIIGGGITGISTGLLLAQHGVNVVVLESHKVGGGATAHSTGNLYFTIDKIFSSLKSKYDTDVVKKVANSRMKALDKIRSWVSTYDLDCDYNDVPWYLYSKDEESCEKIEEEYQTGTDADLPYLRADKNEIPFPNKKGIKLLAQNQINPMKYVQELAKSAHKQQCAIYEHTPVRSVENKDDRFILHSDKLKIEAEYVVHATHSPKGIKTVQTLLGPYREYGIACKLQKNNLPAGIYWGYHNEKKISTRTYSVNDEHFLIVVGEPHKTGQASDNEVHIQNLKNFAHQFFEIQSMDFYWGGQHYRPADLLPYIGPEKKDSKEFIATGFSTDGLVYGTLSAMILSDQITGRKNQWADLYSANRHQPIKAAPKFIKENVNVAGQMVKDYAGTYIKSEDLEAADLQAGEGRIVDYEGKKLAVFRNRDNELEAVSPICTHMKCIVHWNNAEESWDCPCHGSRFKTDGTVLEGPAYQPLEKVDIDVSTG